ncbi:MAG: hypothetical protein RL398_3629 [Planctomycetota bacterium]
MRQAKPPHAAVLPVALLAACAGSPTHDHAAVPQVQWQRSLADAKALAAAESRPLLLAVNMDGESASDRITHENYRDPRFVAASHNYAAVVASLFRHNARDYDDRGRRIPCPRLGCTTCGEHILTEGALFAGPLADGDRVAPRHAVVRPDGRKAWDLSLSFDLLDITNAVTSGAPTARDVTLPTSYDELAALRSHAARTALEAKIEREPGPADRLAALRAITAHGDAGSLDALRLIAADLPTAAPDVRAAFVRTVQARGLGEAMGTVLREFVQTVSVDADDSLPPPAHWLEALRAIDGDSPASRALLSACAAVDGYGARGGVAWADLEALAAIARETAAGAPPLADPYTVELADAADLERELDRLDQALRERRDDAELRAAFGKASLDLARRRIESGGRDVAILLADAELALGRALAAAPQRADWWIHRARTAYLQSDFAAQARHAAQALRIATGSALDQLPPRTPITDATAVEALRWLGDGRLREFLNSVQDTTPDAQPHRIACARDAIRALALVAGSPFADDNDWTGLASACGTMGLWREQFAAAKLGALRLPDALGVRQSLQQALWAGGRADRVADVADAIAATVAVDPSLATARAGALWHAGYAHILHAENLRRAERHAAAIDAYAQGRERFAAAAGAQPAFAANCSLHQALCWLGSGLAEARRHDREAAATCLVNALAQAAIAERATLTTVRDGLGYDVLDLVDKIFEWRARGASPVDPLDLFLQIDTLAPTTAFWAVAIADSQLREALRADGRNPERAMRDTVDAGGKPIRMELGLPNDEGDQYLRRSIEILRRVRDRLTDDADQIALAQADTIWAERNLERGRDEGVAEALAEAAELLEMAGPAADGGVEVWRATATALRQRLGEARPRWRDGR